LIKYDYLPAAVGIKRREMTPFSVICRWNYNAATYQIHDRFIAYILSVHSLARSCQFQSGPPYGAVASDTSIQTHGFRNQIWCGSLSQEQPFQGRDCRDISNVNLTGSRIYWRSSEAIRSACALPIANAIPVSRRTPPCPAS